MTRERECPSLLTIANAAEIAGVSETAVEKWIGKGWLEVVRLGGGPDHPEKSRRHVKLTEVEAIMERRAEAAAKRSAEIRGKLKEVRESR